MLSFLTLNYSYQNLWHLYTCPTGRSSLGVYITVLYQPAWKRISPSVSSLTKRSRFVVICFSWQMLAPWNSSRTWSECHRTGWIFLWGGPRIVPRNHPDHRANTHRWKGHAGGRLTLNFCLNVSLNTGLLATLIYCVRPTFDDVSLTRPLMLKKERRNISPCLKNWLTVGPPMLDYSSETYPIYRHPQRLRCEPYVPCLVSS